MENRAKELIKLLDVYKRQYLNLRFVTVGLAILIGALYLTGMTVLGPYSPRKAVILFLLVVYKVIDGFADVYELSLIHI